MSKNTNKTKDWKRNIQIKFGNGEPKNETISGYLGSLIFAIEIILEEKDNECFARRKKVNLLTAKTVADFYKQKIVKDLEGLKMEEKGSNGRGGILSVLDTGFNVCVKIINEKLNQQIQKIKDKYKL